MDRRFFRNNVKVGSTDPPEEILTSLSGTCGLWQICICVISCIAYFLSEMDELTLTMATFDVNFTCVDSVEKCFSKNKTKCKNFRFLDNINNMTTLTEELYLICENKSYRHLVQHSYRMGATVSPLLVAICATQFGIRATALVMIPLQCLTGVLMINLEHVNLLITLVFFHATFTSVTILLSILAVCDASGNKWRTLTMGTLMLSKHICHAISLPIFGTFSRVVYVIGLNSLLPLMMLIPLLYYQDSPNYVGITTDFSESEEILRKIAFINKIPLPQEARIRPVQILTGSNQAKQTTFFKIWKLPKLRKSYLALLWLHFCGGIYMSIVSYNLLRNHHSMHWCVLSNIGSVFVAILCCHFIPHKVCLGVINFAKGASAGGLVLFYCRSKYVTLSFYHVLLLLCGSLTTTCDTILQNLTPRMFPTEKRMLLLSVCFDAMLFGKFIASFINQSTNSDDNRRVDDHILRFITLIISTLIPILEALACFYLWDVHNRELPDYLVDCLKFERFYKPTRYYCIFDVASEHEIEVKRVELEVDEKHRKRRSTQTLSFAGATKIPRRENDEN